MDKCPRCGTDLSAHSVSWFNTQSICLDCKAEEEACPNYQAAVDAENKACTRGDFNYRGIGLALEDSMVLQRLRKVRQ